MTGMQMLKLLLGLSVVVGGCSADTLAIGAPPAVLPPTAKPEDHTEEFEEFVMPFNGQKFDVFDWNLCTAVAEANPGNVIISPISVKFLLNMLYEGASGDTAKELETILQLPENKSVSRMKMSAVLRSLQTVDPSYELEIGTKIYVDHSLTPKNWFQRVLFLYYNAYIEKLNFTDYKNSAKKVNYWVESVTHGHIKDLFMEGNLNQVVMLLVNAIYFKGTWKSIFQPENTFRGYFQSENGPKRVEYMKQINYFYYAKSPEIKAQILRLPYVGQKFAMYIILPEKKDGLKELIKTVNPFVLRKHIWHMEETSVEVILPKFNFQFKSDLKDILKKVGLNKTFNSFGEMKGFLQNNKSKNLVISKVIQKAGIEVTEEGSVAAAASGMELINKIFSQDELFNASHPFLFFIEDETTGTVVFVGKFMHPETEIEEVTMKPKPKTTTTAAKQQRKPQNRPTEAPKNVTQTTGRHNSPKLFELKQKKMKTELRGRTFSFPENFTFMDGSSP